MRIKKYFSAAFVLLICIFSLTACVPYNPMVITIEELPTDTDVYILLRPDAEYLKERSDDDSMQGTEIWEYNADGWVPASFAVRDVRENRPDTDAQGYKLEVCYKRGYGFDEVADFCETFREMRFAVVDKKGNVKNVSQSYSLIPEDKFGYPDEMIYNAKNDSAEIKYYYEREYKGLTPSGWWFSVAQLSWFTDLAILILLALSLARQRSRFTKGERTALILLSIPAVANIVFAIILLNVPYLNVAEKPSVLSGVNEKVGCNLPFAVVFLVFIITVCVHRHNRKNEKKTD